MNQWTKTIDENSGLVRFQKTFDDGTDVIIYISQDKEKFVVNSSVESRTSGPVDTILHETDNFENACKIAIAKCKEWDLRQNSNALDWSTWKKKD